jgi:hypothetical protein
VFDRQVQAHCHKKDRYSREVCKVMRGSTDVNLEQLRAGMAWWYREYAKEQSPQEREEYAREEEGRRRRAWGSGRIRSQCRRGSGAASRHRGERKCRRALHLALCLTAVIHRSATCRPVGARLM